MGPTRSSKIPEIETPLERCGRQWMCVRLELAELKRAGSQQGIADLKFEEVKLSMQIKRLENLLRLGRQTIAGPI
jgi:hypothetical protein